MLRNRESIKDIVINWIIMLLIIAPLVTASSLGFFWVSFKLLGAI